MADRGSNGMGSKLLYVPGAPPPGMPVDPGAPPSVSSNGVDHGVPMLSAVDQQQSLVGSEPEVVHYEGGGIFADSTPGPSFESLQSEHRGEMAPGARGLDFGPSQISSGPNFQQDGPPPSFGPPSPMMNSMAVAGQFDSPAEGGALGLAVVALATGAVVGVKYGGAYGALAGSLLAGGLVNAVRAFQHFKQGTEQADQEARVSGTYAVGAGALGAVIWHKLAEKPASPMKANQNSRRGSALQFDTAVDNPCAIRPVGP